MEYAYLRASNFCCVLTAPPILVAGATSDSVILLFFGDQWGGSAPIVSALCFAWMVRCLHVLSFNLFVTAGLERAMLAKDLMVLLATLLLVRIGFEFGMVAMAYMLMGGALLDFLITSYLMFDKLGFRPRKIALSLAPGIIIGIVCWVGISFVHPYIESISTLPIVQVGLVAVVAGVLWLACILSIRHPVLLEIAKLVGVRA